MPIDAAAGRPSHRCAAVRVSEAMHWSRSWMSFKTSSGDMLGGTLVKDGFCLVPRGDMAGKSNRVRFQVNDTARRGGLSYPGQPLGPDRRGHFLPYYNPGRVLWSYCTAEVPVL
jgi:hypothetical protein